MPTDDSQEPPEDNFCGIETKGLYPAERKIMLDLLEISLNVRSRIYFHGFETIVDINAIERCIDSIEKNVTI